MRLQRNHRFSDEPRPSALVRALTAQDTYVRSTAPAWDRGWAEGLPLYVKTMSFSTALHISLSLQPQNYAPDRRIPLTLSRKLVERGSYIQNPIQSQG